MTLPRYSMTREFAGKSLAARRILRCFWTRATLPSWNCDKESSVSEGQTKSGTYCIQLKQNWKIHYSAHSTFEIQVKTFHQAAALYLHLRAQNGVVTGQFRLLYGFRQCRFARQLFHGANMPLQQVLHISAVLVSKSFLILVSPKPDAILPAFCRVLVQG